MYPVHPFTVHFPIGLLLVGSLFTFLAARRGGAWDTSAYHCLVAGWLAGLIALITGLVDIARHLAGPEATAVGAQIGWVNAHAFVNLGAVAIYGQALLLRRRRPAILSDAAARGGYLRLHALGAALILIGGWLGGHLVYALGIGT